MDSCFAASSINAILPNSSKNGRNSGFFGEGTRGSLSRSAWKDQVSISLKANQGKVQKGHPGATLAVVTSNSSPDTLDAINSPMFYRQRADPKNVAAIVLGGGPGTQLFPLTKRSATPAVPIGGCYRLIDIPMSNCINSGINKIFVLTQFNSASLNRHLARTYFGNGINFGDGFVEVLAATQTSGAMGKQWFQGTADAVRQFTWMFKDAKNRKIENVVILAGDHLYRMDYMDFVQNHIDRNAEISVACAPVGESRASDFGLVKIDSNGQIIQFSEKPKGSDLQEMRVDTTTLGISPEDAAKSPYVASMGVYIFKTSTLLNLLEETYRTANDFGSEIIPAAVMERNVHAYLFQDYWEDIGTIKSFYDANLALTEEVPKFQFYDPKTPFFTSPGFLPPTKMEKCKIKDAIISHGCFLQECTVEHSIIGERSRLDIGVELKDTIMMGSNYYQTESEIASLLAEGKIPMGIGKNTKIKNCIIDKNAKIGQNVVITNKDGVEEADRPELGFYIRSGITVVAEKAIIEDGTDGGLDRFDFAPARSIMSYRSI